MFTGPYKKPFAHPPFDILVPSIECWQCCRGDHLRVFTTEGKERGSRGPGVTQAGGWSESKSPDPSSALSDLEPPSTHPWESSCPGDALSRLLRAATA